LPALQSDNARHVVWAAASVCNEAARRGLGLRDAVHERFAEDDYGSLHDGFYRLGLKKGAT
jgi:hypothetical protein